MQGTGCLYFVPMTPEDVLAQIRYAYRLAALDGQADLDRDWTFDSPAKEWWKGYVEPAYGDDLSFARLKVANLVPGLNKWFHSDATVAEWEMVLEPCATLGHFCQMVSLKGAQRPVARPCRILGRECETAGAFLALRKLLVDAGIPARRIWPSSPITGVMYSHLEPLLWELGRLAPEALPLLPPKPNLLQTITGWSLLARFVLVFVAFPIGGLYLTMVVLLALFANLKMLFILRRRQLRALYFGEARTFGDLARQVVQSGTAFA